MNLSINLTESQLNQLGQAGVIGIQQQHNYTIQEVINQFSSQFMFKMELLTICFFLAMVFLQSYTSKLQKKNNKNEAWKEHLGYLNIEPIIETNNGLSENDRVLILMSDILFLPSVAFVLTFISYYTGWFA